MSSSDTVHLFEVGPRDGLQNEKTLVSLQDKAWLISSLADAGVEDIEAGSFVRPDKVPQMADSDRLTSEFRADFKSRLWYLVPNRKGLERAIQANVKNIAVFTAATDSFNQKNIGMTVDESFKEISAVVAEAKKAGLKVRGYVSTVWGCPFEGRVEPSKAIAVLERMLSLGVDQLSMGDTIGVAAPNGVEAVLKGLVGKYENSRLAVHFHDTRGTALANALRSHELGIRTFDASIGGLGGCPFAPGATGNLATEDLAYLFKEMNVPMSVSYKKLCETSLELSRRMGNRPLQSRALRAYQSNCNANNAWDI